MKPSLPNRPTTDVDVIACEYFNRMLDCIEWGMSYPRPDNKTLFVDPSGTMRARLPEATASAAAPTVKSDALVYCQSLGGRLETGLPVDVYADGPGQGRIGTGVIIVPELAAMGRIPSGSWVLGHLSSVKLTGGNDT